MNSSLSSKEIILMKCSPIIRTHLFKRNFSLPTVDDKYSFTRVRNELALLIMPIESLEPLSYWYNISDNDKGSLCELFRLEDCVILSIMNTCGLIRQKEVNGEISISIENDKWIKFSSQYELSNIKIIMSKIIIVIDNKLARKDMIFLHIGAKSSSSYLKATSQYNHHILCPLIKMRQLSHNFVNSVSTDILETIHWSEVEILSDALNCNNLSWNC